MVFAVVVLILVGCSPGKRALRHYEPEFEAPRREAIEREAAGQEGGAYEPPLYREGQAERTGVASWYGPGFHGKLTASGEPYNMYDFTCAHNTYPLGTQLRVTNLRNGESVLVIVNDRGPFAKDREIDLSYAAADRLGIIGPGTAEVKLEPVGWDARYVKYDKSYSIEKGPFTVQVASFTDRFNAVQLQKGLKLRYESHDPYLIEADVNGERRYRVRVGKFETREKAQSLADALLDEGYSALVCAYEEQI